MAWEAFLAEVKRLPLGLLWRHNQAGDLPGSNNLIDADALASLTKANTGRRGFTYTHKPVLPGQADNPTIEGNANAIAKANAGGFTVNLSADTLKEADALAALGIAPVAVLLPKMQLTNTATPAGRKVVVCPAVTRENVSCMTCGLCQRSARSVIVGFPAHGPAKNIATAVALG